MGGWGSGRHGGHRTADESLRIDLAWMMRNGLAAAGVARTGSLQWTCRGEPSGNISYTCDMRDEMNASMTLKFTVTNHATGQRRDYIQRVPMTFSVPNLGGKRWWMLCPFTHRRVAKLYCPPGGHEFASRHAWKLGYQSQRIAKRDRPFERLFALQKKLGCDQGAGRFIYRPKGMWQRTFDKHLAAYLRLERDCDIEMRVMLDRLNGRLK